MGGLSINNSKEISSSGDVNAASFNGSYGRFAKNVSISEDLTVTGFSTFGKSVSMNSYLTVKNGIDLNSYIAPKTNSSSIQIGGGGSSNQNAVLINVSGGAGDGYLSLNGDNNSSVELDVWGSKKIRGDLTLSASNDGKIKGGIRASGSIAGRYIQPTSMATTGETCSPNGLISKSTDGSPVWCIAYTSVLAVECTKTISAVAGDFYLAQVGITKVKNAESNLDIEATTEIGINCENSNLLVLISL